MTRSSLILAGVLTTLISGPRPGLAQSDVAASLDARSEEIPSGKRAYQETWLLPVEGVAAPGPEATAFGGRVNVFQDAGRERIELHAVADGALQEPVVIVFDGDAYHLVTAVGATPFLESMPAQDAWVALVLSGPAGQAEEYRTIPADGGIAAVVLRSDVSADFDAGEAFALRKTSVGRSLLKSGVASFSAAETEVAASAGARGVGRVKTADGEIDVTPDPGAVDWMEEIEIDLVAFEAFRREAGLAPYDAIPGEEVE